MLLSDVVGMKDGNGGMQLSRGSGMDLEYSCAQHGCEHFVRRAEGMHACGEQDGACLMDDGIG